MLKVVILILAPELTQNEFASLLTLVTPEKQERIKRFHFSKMHKIVFWAMFWLVVRLAKPLVWLTSNSNFQPTILVNRFCLTTHIFTLTFHMLEIISLVLCLTNQLELTLNSLIQ